jgi:hypothetical protein
MDLIPAWHVMIPYFLESYIALIIELVAKLNAPVPKKLNPKPTKPMKPTKPLGS